MAGVGLGEGYSFQQDAGFAVNAILEEMGFERIPGLLAGKRKIVCSAFVDLCARSQRLVARPDRKPGDVTPPGLSYSSKVRFTENHNLWELQVMAVLLELKSDVAHINGKLDSYNDLREKVDVVCTRATETEDRAKSNTKRLDKLEANNTWLWRTVVAAIISAMVLMYFKK